MLQYVCSNVTLEALKDLVERQVGLKFDLAGAGNITSRGMEVRKSVF